VTYSVVIHYKLIGGIYCLHLQDRNFFAFGKVGGTHIRDVGDDLPDYTAPRALQHKFSSTKHFPVKIGVYNFLSAFLLRLHALLLYSVKEVGWKD
jgi:hypothetical protein